MLNKKNERKYWTDEEWDNSSVIRKKFKEITGMTLDDTMVKLLLAVAISSILCTLFLN